MCFFEKFFKKTGRQGEQLENQLPESGKNRAQQSAGSTFPQKTTAQQTHPVAQPQVTAADGKAQIQPYTEGKQNENSVCSGSISAAQGPQKTIHKAAQTPQQTGNRQPGSGYGRGDHPNRRRIQPPL